MKKLQKADYIKMYSFMLKIRRFEERAAQLYGMGKIGGFCHLYIGQEAVVVGILMTIDKNDSVVTTYRDHGHMIARGLDPKRIMAELTGREDGYSAGKGGSMHLTDVEKGAMGSYAIIGAHLPIAAGAAWSAQYRKSGQVAFCFFGDGTTNIGAFHEAINIAAIWKLPVIFVCENNL